MSEDKNIKVFLTDCQVDFIKGNGECMSDGSGNYYSLPQWYKEVDENIFEVISFENLPQHLKDMIIQFRTDVGLLNEALNAKNKFISNDN